MSLEPGKLGAERWSADNLRAQWRRWRLGVETLLGKNRRGFFIPYRLADQMPSPGDYPAAAAALARARPRFDQVLEALEAMKSELLRIQNDAEPPEPRWNQDWLVPLDAAVLYGMIRWRRPQRIIEVGSGHSTRFMARAIRDTDLKTEITAIDPAPRADISGLKVRQIRSTLQQTDAGVFAALRSGDVLFIDSSHLLMPGTDVDLLFGKILPALPSGALVHVHDIFLPDDYPPAWRWRGYNEQLGILQMILGNQWRPLFASHFAVTRMAEAMAKSVVATLPSVDAPASSLWLEKA